MPDRQVNVILNTDMLVTNRTPAMIFHGGITRRKLQELTGCVRKSSPIDFWHKSGSLSRWVGRQVLFVLTDDGDEPFSVSRVIDSIIEKPAEDINAGDLEGTLAEIAMREGGITFLEFFRKIHCGSDRAMIIRVSQP